MRSGQMYAVAREERQRRQRRVVGGVAVEILRVGIHAIRSSGCAFLSHAHRSKSRRMRCNLPVPADFVTLGALARVRGTAIHGPPPVQDRHAHRRRRHHRPGRRLARGQGLAAHRRRSARVDELNSTIGVLLAEALPDADRRVPHRCAARPVRPRRRAVDPRLHARSPTPTSSASRPTSSASTPTSRRSRNSSCPGGTRAAALAHVARTVCRRAERSLVAAAATEAITRPSRDVPQPPVRPAVRARARAEPRRRPRRTSCGRKAALTGDGRRRPATDKSARLAALLSRIALGDQAAFARVLRDRRRRIYTASRCVS